MISPCQLRYPGQVVSQMQVLYTIFNLIRTWGPHPPPPPASESLSSSFALSLIFPGDCCLQTYFIISPVQSALGVPDYPLFRRLVHFSLFLVFPFWWLALHKLGRSLPAFSYYYTRAFCFRSGVLTIYNPLLTKPSYLFLWLFNYPSPSPSFSESTTSEMQMQIIISVLVAAVSFGSLVSASPIPCPDVSSSQVR